MKKLGLFLFTILVLFLPQSSLAAEQIKSFHATLKINTDSSIDVRETILYDFGFGEKHGIFRDIPIKYKARGGSYNLRISNIVVTDENNNPLPAKISNQGKNKRLKIGDPDTLVTGEKTYIISYHLLRAINFFQNHDELYWNVTGTQWQVPILNSSASVQLPQSISPSDLKLDCFSGVADSNQKCFKSDVLIDEKGQTQELNFREEELGPGENLTIVVGLPKGIIVEPSLQSKIGYLILDNWVLFLPLLVFLFLFYLWFTRGRDPAGKVTIVPQYDPPVGLSPSEVGTVIDERVQNLDISADIIQLAMGGYLKIARTQKPTDYILEKLKNIDNSLASHQKKLLKSLFKNAKTNIKLSDLKDNFYDDFLEIRDNIYDTLVLKGYFPKNPQAVRGLYFTLGFIVMIIGFFLGFISGFWTGFSLALSGLIILVFAYFMPRRTLKGVLTKEYILGLKRYIAVAEKERIKFHNAPERSPQLFEKLLPYAMVLKVEKDWAQQFKDIYTQPPNWYSDPTGATFSAVLFTNSLSSFNSNANRSLTSNRSSAASGGSGFSGGSSGGGFGGGGGGSW